MKKMAALLVALGVLAFGAVAFGRGWGGPGSGCGGPGYGGGPANGGGPGFMYGLADSEEGKKFLEDTKELRKKMHDLRFELREAWIADDEKKAEKLEAEIEKVQEEIRSKAEKAGIENKRGYGKRGWGKRGGPGNGCGGPGYGCGGPGGPGGDYGPEDQE